MMSPASKAKRAAQVRAYRSNTRVYRLISRREASLMVGKANRRYANDPATNFGAW